MSRGLRLIPIILVVWILGTFAWRLIQPSDPTVHSQLVNRELPRFELPSPVPGSPGLRSADLVSGEPRLLNLFASWCVPCIAEAPVLEELKRRGVKIDGIAIRDTPAAVGAFLDRHGNPYARIGSDPNSRVQFALGSVDAGPDAGADIERLLAMLSPGAFTCSDDDKCLFHPSCRCTRRQRTAGITAVSISTSSFIHRCANRIC